MGRGNIKLFKDIFEPTPAKITVKGRSRLQIDKRNRCLVDRYIFYVVCTERRYESILALLSDDFFLSTATIPEILSEQVEAVKAAKKHFQHMEQKNVIKELKEKWKGFNWALDYS